VFVSTQAYVNDLGLYSAKVSEENQGALGMGASGHAE